MRIVKHTSRFRRDYKREKSGRYAKRLDAELLEAVTPLAKDEPSADRISIIRSAASGAITASATSGPIRSSFIEGRTTPASSLFGSTRTASLACRRQFAAQCKIDTGRYIGGWTRKGRGGIRELGRRGRIRASTLVRHEIHRDPVDAVAEMGRWRSVVNDVSKMTPQFA